MQANHNEVLWVEKYRPQTIDECILPKSLKTSFIDIVAGGRIPNLLLTGGAGTGKTTAAKALCNELGVDWIVINASEENGIDILRTKIKDFASTVSLSDLGKCVIMDEADHLTPQAQAAFRGMIEAFSQNCSFIFTANFPNRIIDPLHSRMVQIHFEISKAEEPVMQAKFFHRVCEILKAENIQYDQKAVVALVTKFFPDNRRTLNQLQQFARSGSIGTEILLDLQDINISSLVKAIKEKKFKDIRQWCTDNADNDLSGVYTKLYRALKDFVDTQSIPEAILILEDYQRYDAVVPDKELHLAAMCVNLMMQLNFK